MTSPMNVPVGGCGDAPPAGDTSNAVAHARGVLQVEAESLRAQRDDLARTVEVLLAALDGGAQWEIDTARHLARRELTYMKDQP